VDQREFQRLDWSAGGQQGLGLPVSRRNSMRSGARAQPETNRMAFEEIMIAEGSDWTGVGPEHTRRTIASSTNSIANTVEVFYQALGGPRPIILAQPIIAGVARLRSRRSATSIRGSPRHGALLPSGWGRRVTRA